MANKVTCKICQQNFKNEEGLAQHTSAKHSNNADNETKTDKSTSKNYIWIVIGIICLVGVIYFITNATGGPGEYDAFAQCLTQSGFIMYGAYWCPHCIDQKELFGKSVDEMPYVECSLPNRAGQTLECTAAGIEGYPTWQLPDGKRRSGVLSLKELSSLSNCPLP